MKRIKTTLVRIAVTAVLILLLVISFRIGANFSSNQQDKEIIKIKTDTLKIHDTIRVEKPVYITKVVLDSILVPVSVVDTLMKVDTIFINMPREQKYYKDENYEAWVSGFRPELDSLKIFRISSQINTTYHYPIKKANRFSVGIQLGYGITISKEPQLSPFIGLGISYNLFSF